MDIHDIPFPRLSYAMTDSLSLCDGGLRQSASDNYAIHSNPSFSRSVPHATQRYIYIYNMNEWMNSWTKPFVDFFNDYFIHVGYHLSSSFITSASSPPPSNLLNNKRKIALIESYWTYDIIITNKRDCERMNYVHRNCIVEEKEWEDCVTIRRYNSEPSCKGCRWWQRGLTRGLREMVKGGGDDEIEKNLIFLNLLG